tara:strand:+ start:15265 stop:16956 length:1692 start_codon:yes stop_codon:yes gene_type:complete
MRKLEEPLKIMPIIGVTVCFLLFTILSFWVYLERTLEGDINNHILAGEMFGTPSELVQKGIKPLYHGEGQTGWDGQFYYYMANDLLGLKDTAVHIDAPAYRYQRIGMSLFAAIIAKLINSDWVSPILYIYSYLTLITIASIVGARLLQSMGVNPYWILLWSLSAGTQITLFNALPDAAADSFLIIAIGFIVIRRYFFASVFFSFAALSREVYAIFPAAILFVSVVMPAIANLSRENFKARLLSLFFPSPIYFLLIPCIVVVGWQAYVISHFGVAPSKLAHGILGAPFSAWYEYFMSSVRGHHKLVGAGWVSIAELLSLASFLFILVLSAIASVRVVLCREEPFHGGRGLALAWVMLIGLYACFGPTVMMHYTGYFKAISIFLFLIPLYLGFCGFSSVIRRILFFIIIVIFCQVGIYNMKARILPVHSNLDKYTKMSSVSTSGSYECFNDYRYSVEINDIEYFRSRFLSGLPDYMLMNINVVNLSSYPWISHSLGLGSVHMSYQWLDVDNNVVVDGIRSAILNKVNPQDSINTTLFVAVPHVSDVHLELSPVQEGCAWFHNYSK